MIKRIIVCDVCGKEENFDNPWRIRWFIESVVSTICTKECFEKFYAEKLKKEKVIMKIKKEK